MNEVDVFAVQAHLDKLKHGFEADRKFEMMKAAEAQSKKKKRQEIIESLFESQKEKEKFEKWLLKRERGDDLKSAYDYILCDSDECSKDQDEEPEPSEDESSDWSTDDESFGSYIDELMELIEEFIKDEADGKNDKDGTHSDEDGYGDDSAEAESSSADSEGDQDMGDAEEERSSRDDWNGDQMDDNGYGDEGSDDSLSHFGSD